MLIKKIAKKVLCKLPEPIQLSVIENYLDYKKRTLHKRRLPDVLTFFVTTMCNARCAHCFYWEELNTQRNELTLDEIEKIAASMSAGLGSLALTGGGALAEERSGGDLQDLQFSLPDPHHQYCQQRHLPGTSPRYMQMDTFQMQPGASQHPDFT